MAFNPNDFTPIEPVTPVEEPQLPTAAAPLEGGKAAMPRLMAKLQGQGWPTEAAAGIVGNWMGEGAGHSGQWEKSGGGGFGHAQWTGPRRKALAAFATEQGKPADDEDVQLAFFQHEMDTKFPGLKAKLMSGNISADQATKMIESQYEAPGKPTTGARLKYARQAASAAAPPQFGQGTNLYDEETAKQAGLGPDETGHWPSRIPTGPNEGLLLKHKTHPTFWMTMKGELEQGNTVYEAPNGRMYSFSPDKKVPEDWKVYTKPKPTETPAEAFNPADFTPIDTEPAVDPLSALDLGPGLKETPKEPEPAAPSYFAPLPKGIGKAGEPTDPMAFAGKWLTSYERQQATEKLIPNAMVERAEADYKGTPAWLRWAINQRWTPEEVKTWEGQYAADRTFLLNTAEKKEQISRIAANILPRLSKMNLPFSTQTTSSPTGHERPFAEHPSQQKITNTQSMAEILTKDPVWSLWQGAAESIGRFAALQPDKDPEHREFIENLVAWQLSPSPLPPTTNMYHNLWRLAFRSVPGLAELMALQAAMPIAGATWAARIGKEAAVFGLHAAMEPTDTWKHIKAGVATGAAFGGLGGLAPGLAKAAPTKKIGETIEESLARLTESRAGKVLGGAAIGYGGEWMFNPEATDESLKMASILTGLYGLMAGPGRTGKPKLSGKQLTDIIEGWQKTMEELRTVPKDVMEQVKANALRGEFTGEGKQFEGYFLEPTPAKAPPEAGMYGMKEPMISAREPNWESKILASVTRNLGKETELPEQVVSPLTGEREISAIRLAKGEPYYGGTPIPPSAYIATEAQTGERGFTIVDGLGRWLHEPLATKAEAEETLAQLREISREIHRPKYQIEGLHSDGKWRVVDTFDTNHEAIQQLNRWTGMGTREPKISARDDRRILTGYRGTEGRGYGTEGEGLYVARKKGLAEFFGPVQEVKYTEPRNPLIVNEEPLPLLDDSFPIFDEIHPDDSLWIRLNKQAIKNTGIGPKDPWGQSIEKVTGELTRLLKEKGYDAVSITSGGDSWDVILDKSLLVTEPKISAREPAPTFYSRMQEFVEPRLPGKQSGKGYAGLLKGWAEKGQFKSDELKWSGVLPWLEGQKGTVSKQQVMDYLEGEGQVKLEEVTKEQGIVRGPDVFDYTKFSQWQLPGPKENYTELLLTMPPTGMSDSNISAWREQSMMNRYGPDAPYYTNREPWSELSEAEKTFWRKEYKLEVPAADLDFTGGHWSEPNVLAHIRFNNRVDAKGRKGLFVEEVQSDWHQKGKKEGYRGEYKTSPSLDAIKRSISAQLERIDDYDAMIDKLETATEKEPFWAARRALYDELDSLRIEESRIKTDLGQIGVPPAPFSKTWHELAMKRILRYAAENDYEWVGWTTGEQQAERYDLSKHIDHLYWDKNAAGEFTILATDKGGYDINIPDNRNIPANKLEDYVGKDVAAKIIRGEGRAVPYPGEDSVASGVLDGIDLKIGGEWAKRLYDEMIPQFLNKYGKQWGARVGSTELAVESAWSEELGREITTAEMKPDKVHSLDLTPSMKESVLYKGQPLFKEREHGKTQAEKAAEGAIKSPLDSVKGPEGLSDLSENERATRQLLDDFKSGGSEESPEWREFFGRTEHSVGLERTSEFQDIASYLKAAGIDNVIPTKDMPARGAFWIDEQGKSWIFLDENTGANTARQIADHELVHWADDSGLSSSVLRLRSMIDTTSSAFNGYRKVVEDSYNKVGLSKPNNETVKAELLADYLAGIKRTAGLLGRPINMERAFLNSAMARKLTGSYREEVSSGRLREMASAAQRGEPRLSIKDYVKDAYRDRGKAPAGLYREKVNRAQGALKQAAKDAWDWWTKLPKETDFKTALGDYLGVGRQIAGYETEQKIRTINDAIPVRARQEAITNWIEADGDTNLLRERANQTTNPSLKAGYEAATELTADELAVAQGVKQYFSDMLKEAQKYGLLEEGINNYVTHIWGENKLATKTIIAESNAGMFDADFDYAKKRILSTYFEGEQKGYVPKDKRIGYLVGKYHQAIGEAIAARKFIKDMLSGTAKDGNPLVAVTEGALPIDPPTGEDLSIIRPRMTEQEAARTGKYVPLPHTALKKWKWVVKDQAGKNVFKRGDLWVHEDIAKHLDNVLKRSALRKTPVGRGIMNLQQEFKSTLLTGAFFHQVQLGEHATFHWMSPLNPPDIDFSQPLQRLAVQKGLMIYDHNALAEFGEGLHATGLINRLPGIGPIAQAYGNWLFRENIPKLKMALCQIVFRRNMERYAGKGSEGQIMELSASQANAAFGELNYKWMGRNPTTQDVLRLLALAPDFFEARLRFAGQSISPYGREQALALARGALMMYGASTLLNMVFSDDKKPHFDKPFTFVNGGKEYTMRSIPGDIIHAFKDPIGFLAWRASPTTTRTLVELFSRRDINGRKRSPSEIVQDFFTAHVPIPLQSEANKMLGVSKRELTALEAIGQTFGLVTYKHFTDAEKVALQHWSDHRVDLPPEEQKLSAEHKKVVNLVKGEKVDDAWQRVAKLVERGELSEDRAVAWVNNAGKSDFARLPIDVLAKALSVAQPNESVDILGQLENRNLERTDKARLKKALPFIQEFIKTADPQVLEVYGETISDLIDAIAEAG